MQASQNLMTRDQRRSVWAEKDEQGNTDLWLGLGVVFSLTIWLILETEKKTCFLCHVSQFIKPPSSHNHEVLDVFFKNETYVTHIGGVNSHSSESLGGKQPATSHTSV
jgi:hypothetical protein